MTRRKSGAAHVVEQSRERRRPSDFPRPDAERAEHDPPPHERADERSREEAQRSDDEAHGYSQDSGYQGSGGYTAAARGEGDRVESEVSPTGNGHADSDQQIRSHIEQRLARERAPRARRLIVSVGTGVVTLRGEVDDDFERRRLVDLVRGIQSVRELRDELTTRGGAN